MKLRKYVKRYADQRDLKPSTIAGYVTAVNVLDDWHGEPIRFKQLSDKLLNAFLSWSLDQPVSRYTTRTRRTQLLALCRSARRDKVSKYKPKHVKPIKVPKPIVDFWTPDEMRRLIEAAERIPGVFRSTGLQKGPFLAAAIAAAWDTGLRRGDLLRLTLEQIHRREFIVIQSKTQSEVFCRVNEATVRRVDALGGPPRELAFPMWAGPDRLVALGKKAMRAAGLQSSRSHFWHLIRRSATTHVESIQPGAGQDFAGHDSPATTRNHYIAREQIHANVPTPMSIAG